MRLLKIFFLIFTLFAVQQACAQNRFNDSVFSTKPELTFGLDGRYTRVLNRGVQISGVRAGLEWNRKYRAGIGYYWLLNKVYMPYNDGINTHNSRLHIRYVAPYVEYTFFQSERWQFNAQFQAGAGGKFLRYSSNNNNYDKDIGLMILGDVGISGHYKLLSFIGLSGGVGYRQMLLPKALNTEGLSAPYANLNLKLFPLDLYYFIYEKIYNVPAN